MVRLRLVWTVCVLSVILALTGCAGLATMKNQRDDFRSDTISSLNYNVLAGTGFGGGQVRFNLRKITNTYGANLYYADIVYIGNQQGWLFIQDGESLRLLIDGERFSLSGTGSLGAREVFTIGNSVNVRESATYPISPEMIKKMASAKEVRIRIEGQRDSAERHFSKGNFKNFQKFSAKHIKD